MATARALYFLMLADFLERIRRYSFLVVLAVTVLAGYSMVPAVDAPYNAFAIGVYRPFYNSAWVGTVFGIVVATLVTLLGFFLVRNSVTRDYRTRVGHIIATTPISKPLYMLGKWLSNVAVLSSILVILTVVALVMQLIRAEDTHIDLWALVAPIWFMGFPPLTLVAAASILFECVPIPSGLGNIVFLLLWFLIGFLVVFPIVSEVNEQQPANDLFGMSHVMVALRNEMISQGLDPSEGVTDLYQPTGGQETQRFTWNGISWDLKIFFGRCLWLALAAAIVLVAAIPFNRFDPAKGKKAVLNKTQGKANNRRRMQPVSETIASSESTMLELVDEAQSLTPLSDSGVHSRFWTTIVSECYLMVKGRSLWWYASTLAIAIAAIFTSNEHFLGFVVPISWLWPIFVWSQMGTQERKHNVNLIVFPVAHLMKRQLPALWLAGVAVAVLATSVVALRLALGGAWVMFLGWVTACVFIPALALALGVWTNGGRTFEIVYFVLWLAAAKDPIVLFNFMGRSTEPNAEIVPLIYLAISALLLVLSAIGRKKQIVSSLK